MYVYLLSFFAMSFLGWLMEVAFAAIVDKKFVNRGFLNGPVCPIYGIGVVLMDGALGRFNSSAIIMLGAFVIGTALEFVAGFLLEKIFNQKWWDYSKEPHNFMGYICLKYSVAWAILGVIVVKTLMPILRTVIGLIPGTLGIVLLIVFGSIFVIDLVITTASVIGFNRRLKNLERISAIMRHGSDLIGSRVSSIALAGDKVVLEIDGKRKEKLIALEEKYRKSVLNNHFHTRILKAFPDLRSIKYNEELEELRNNFRLFTKNTTDVFRKREEAAVAAYENPIPRGIEKPFAYGFSFEKMFWIFMIGNVIGFLLETVYCLIMPPHQFEWRVSLVIGPFILVYGFGAIVFTVFLYSLYDKRDVLIFFLSMVIGGAFEYICSFAQHAMFGTVSWEYSDTTLSLNGRTNLMYSVFWGILGVLWIKDIYPRLSRLIEKAPKKPAKIVTKALVVFMIFDMLLSAGAVYRQSERVNNIPATNVIQEFFDEYYNDEVLAKIYPGMQYVGAIDEKL